MHGKKAQFTVSGITLTLARPSLAEMAAIEESLRNLLGEPDHSEFSGDIDKILGMAVADESEADREAFDKLQDTGDRLELWDAWVNHAELKKFLFQRGAAKLEYITSERTRQFQAAGFTPQEAQKLVEATQTPSSTNPT